MTLPQSNAELARHHDAEVLAPRTRGASSVAAETRLKRTIAVGGAADLPRALEHPAVASLDRLEIVGVVEVGEPTDDGVALDASSLAKLVAERQAGTVLVAGPLGHADVRALTDVALVHNCRLLAIPPTARISGHVPVVVWGQDSPLIRLADIPYPRLHRAAKRALDVVASGLGLLVAAPLVALIAVAIRLESKGPVFFRHRRLGRYGRAFDCLKLRTMTDGAEAALQRDPALLDAYRANHFKIPERSDPRITRVGRILRRTSFDEIPQLLNVFRGDMSLVGPRPVVAEELSQYGAGQTLLLSVRPGLTGAWAVNGRHHTGYPRRAALELEYVRRWTFVGDMAILLRTLSALRDPGED